MTGKRGKNLIREEREMYLRKTKRLFISDAGKK